MKTYLLVQPVQNPPGNPGGVDPRGGQPVPIAGTFILILAAVVLAFYMHRKKQEISMTTLAVVISYLFLAILLGIFIGEHLKKNKN